MACIAPIILGIILYNDLPQQMAIHFSFDNTPNNYADKNFAVFGFPVIMLLIQLLMCVVVDLTQEKQNNKLSIVTKWIIPIISIGCYTAMMLFGIGKEIEMRVWVTLLIGIVFIILGNYLPKAEQNYAIGVRLRSTLNNKEVWKKINRIEGYAMVIIGFLLIITSFLTPITSVIVLVLFILQTIAMFIYSGYLGKK